MRKGLEKTRLTYPVRGEVEEKRRRGSSSACGVRVLDSYVSWKSSNAVQAGPAWRREREEERVLRRGDVHRGEGSWDCDWRAVSDSERTAEHRSEPTQRKTRKGATGRRGGGETTEGGSSVVQLAWDSPVYSAGSRRQTRPLWNSPSRTESAGKEGRLLDSRSPSSCAQCDSDWRP